MNTTSETLRDLLKTGMVTRKAYYFAINKTMECRECERQQPANKFSKTPDELLPDYCDVCLSKYPILFEEIHKLLEYYSISPTKTAIAINPHSIETKRAYNQEAMREYHNRDVAAQSKTKTTYNREYKRAYRKRKREAATTTQK